jgi:hypothetical protein
MKTALAGDTPVQLPGGGYWLAPDQGVPMVSVEPDPRYTGAPMASDQPTWIPPAPQEQGLLGRLFGIY